MLRGLYMAASAMSTETKRVDVLANNIANADTNGYKRDEVITGPFREVLISKINDRGPDRLLASSGRLSVERQDDKIRLEISGRYFVIDTLPGKSFCRETELTVNPEGYLVTTSGNYILGSGGRIQPGSMENLYIDQSGAVYSNGRLLDRLQLNTAPGVIGTLNGGAAINKVVTSFLQGNLKETFRSLDMAIKGDGFFCLRVDGTEMYTRDGSFVTDSEGYLSSAEGYRVIGDMGWVYIGDEEFRLRSDGEIYSDDYFIDRLKLVTFERPQELEKVGDNLYRTVGGNIPYIGIQGEVLQGFLESSNINTIKEMVSMISAFRDYEANQRVITAYDETMGKAVNEVGRV